MTKIKEHPTSKLQNRMGRELETPRKYAIEYFLQKKMIYQSVINHHDIDSVVDGKRYTE